MADVNIDAGSATPWGAAANFALGLIDRLIPDKAEADKQKLAVLGLVQNGQLAAIQAAAAVDQAQAATNTAQAQSRSFWTSGARPAILWICALALAYDTMGQPLLSWVMGALKHWPPAPPLDMGSVMTLLVGMLGLSTQRTIERINGVIPPGK